MYEWQAQIQMMADEIDRCILRRDNEALTLQALSARMGYSGFYTTRKFTQITGMRLHDYLRRRRLAFALREVRDSDRRLLDIAVDYGFSSNEAFTRAFRRLYGVTPSAYRKNPFPVVLRTRIRPFDICCMNTEEASDMHHHGEVRIYFEKLPAHRYLHIRNYESDGYWDFWQKQANVPGQDCETVCGLLESIPGKLDDMGSGESNSGAGQIMALIHDPAGRPFGYGVPRAESYGVRLPADYDGPVPEQMQLMDVAEGEYVVFEHGPFDYETENCIVGERVHAAIAAFTFEGTGYCFDDSPGRTAYFFHDVTRFCKWMHPVRRV